MKKTLFIIGAFLLAQVIVGLCIALSIMLLAASRGETITESMKPGSTDILVALLVSDIIVIVATILICRKGFAEPFRWKMPVKGGLLATGLSIVGILALATLMEALSEWLNLPDYMADTFKDLSVNPLALWSIALIGPLAEEVACRYGITGSLMETRKLPIWAVIVISALIFGLLHMNPAQMLVAFIVGIFLGWLYVVTRSIWPCLVCHAVNNAVGVIMMQQSNEDVRLADFIGNNTLFIAVLCGSAVVFVLVVTAISRLTRSFPPN
ncbi:MAG: CPBP family intramembrane metalloprotease [Bacteroidaceae bacterium]|nr:CPBP family intramembrane metalloprotease [Bacteroidaceae bacterium]